MEVKSFASKFEVKSMDDLQFLRNMSPKELDEWCDANTKKSKTVPTAKKRQIFFRDTAKVSLKGGHGGSGIASFERVAHKRVGPPNGGDGGPGGDIIIKAINSEPNLRHLKSYYGGGSGGSGGKDKKKGKKGETITINVPIGTTITEFLPSKFEKELSDKIPEEMQDFEFEPYDVQKIMENVNSDKLEPFSNDDTDLFTKKIEAKMKKVADQKQLSDKTPGKEVKGKETETKLKKIDLLREGEFFVACRGGKAGLGNVHFATGSNRSPQKCTTGKEGEKKWYLFELKMIAQVGLVGFPNAGKSSLLAAISNATPKIANYPFTTLSPSIGTVQWGDHFSISVADLPGIIEDAHKNRGLGIEFLKHIERTHILCFVLDMSGTEGDPLEDLQILRNELKLYKEELLQRTAFIVANKVDVAIGQKNYEKFSKAMKEDDLFKDIPIFPVSALKKTGLDPLKENMRTIIEANESATKVEQKNYEVIDVTEKFQRLWEKIERD